MKIILALPIIIGAFILTGCKSPSEVRQSGPEEIFHSNKNVNDVSECILSGWQEKSFLTGLSRYIFSLIKTVRLSI